MTNTETKDPQKYKCSGYGLAFSTNTLKHLDSGGNGKNIIIFGADLSHSKYGNNKKQFILVLGYGTVQKKQKKNRSSC